MAIRILIVLMLATSLNAQIGDHLNKSKSDLSNNFTDGQTSLDKTYFETYIFEVLRDIMANIDTTMKITTNYASIQAAIDALGSPGKHGWVVIPPDVAAGSYTKGDSTMVFDFRSQGLTIDGDLAFNDALDYHAGALYTPNTNGAPSAVIESFIPTKSFDSTTVSDTVGWDFRLPDNFTSIDSVLIEVLTDSTNGDSVAFAFKFKGVSEDSVFTDSFGSAQADTIDLGTTALTRKILRYTTALSGLTAGDRFIGKLYRDQGISNNQAGLVHVVNITFHGKGLLDRQ